MSNTVYSNTVLESKMTELLNSRLEVRALMDVDDSLGEGAGLSKVIRHACRTAQRRNFPPAISFRCASAARSERAS